MGKQILYFGLSALCFYLGIKFNFFVALLAFAWVPALLSSEEDSSPLHLSLGLFGLLTASLATDGQWALANGIAWTCFIFARKLWGQQRAFLAFLFLLLSAEALPFYTAWPKNLSLFLSESLYQNEFWQPWLLEAGFLGASFQLLLLALLISFLILKVKSGQAFPKLLFGLILIIAGLPLILCLNGDSSLSPIAPSHEEFQLLAIDQFIARLSLFLAFFLLLFALVRKLLPKHNADDRFT